MSVLVRTLFTLFTIAVFISTIDELISEFSSGEPLAAMLDDLAMFAIALVVLGLLVREFRAKQSAIRQLRAQLAETRGRLDQIDNQAPIIGRQYHAVMQKQFDAWGLTLSEQQVVILMLKGLSFREVAGVRETKEKTVRQQATSVYRKSGLSGRHELAAWFLEDLLDPGESDQERPIDKH